MPRATALYPPTRAGALQLHRDHTTTSVPQAGIFFKLGANASYDAVARGDAPFPVLKIGRKFRVPTAAILQALGLDPAAEPANDQPAADAAHGPDAAA